MLLFSISEALTWTQEPDKPTKVIEDGVNNKNVRLTWTYAVDPGDNIFGFEFIREDKDGRNRIAISSRLQNSAFEAKNNFGNRYRGELLSQLLIFNVDNVKEYRYTLEAIIIVGSSFDRVPSSAVVVEVFGK